MRSWPAAAGGLLWNLVTRLESMAILYRIHRKKRDVCATRPKHRLEVGLVASPRFLWRGHVTAAWIERGLMTKRSQKPPPAQNAGGATKASPGGRFGSLATLFVAGACDCGLD